MITIDEHEPITNNMTKQCKNFMERVEDKIGNAKKPLFDGKNPEIVYYSAFGDIDDAAENVLTYGEDIQDQKGAEVSEDYIKAIDNYIVAKVVAPYKYFITFLARANSGSGMPQAIPL